MLKISPRFSLFLTEALTIVFLKTWLVSSKSCGAQGCGQKTKGHEELLAEYLVDSNLKKIVSALLFRLENFK